MESDYGELSVWDEPLRDLPAAAAAGRPRPDERVQHLPAQCGRPNADPHDGRQRTDDQLLDPPAALECRRDAARWCSDRTGLVSRSPYEDARRFPPERARRTARPRFKPDLPRSLRPVSICTFSSHRFGDPMRWKLLCLVLLMGAGYLFCLAGCKSGRVRLPETHSTLEGTVTYGKEKVLVAMISVWGDKDTAE